MACIKAPRAESVYTSTILVVLMELPDNTPVCIQVAETDTSVTASAHGLALNLFFLGRMRGSAQRL